MRIFLSVMTACLACLKAQAGYTHYYTWNQKPNDSDLTECVKEMRLIIEARKDILAGPKGPGSPIIIDSTHVDLNGIGDDEHEPFVFPRHPGFNFCKTEGKPYDEVVTACLMVARDHFPPSVLSIRSDGSWETRAWENGAKLYSSVLKRPARNPIDGPGLGSSSIHRSLMTLAVLVLALAGIFLWLLKTSKLF